jgi:hypothetical protein
MLNRSLRLTMVKDEPNPDNPPVDIDRVASAVSRNVIKVLAVYVSLDIARKAAVYLLSAKV